MGSPRLIPRLDTSSVVFSPTTPDFSGYVAQQLGDWGSGRDGFDAIFAGPASIIDSDTSSVADLDPQIAAADFTAGDFATTYHAPVDGELPGFLSDGDTLNGAVQDPGEVTGSPVITPPPNPPGGSSSSGSGVGAGSGDGGSGGGDPGIGSGDNCTSSDAWPWCDPFINGFTS